MSDSKITKIVDYKLFDLENDRISWIKVEQNSWSHNKKWVLNNVCHVDRYISNVLEQCAMTSFHKDLSIANVLLLDSTICVWWERKVIGYLIREDSDISLDYLENRKIIKDPNKKELSDLEKDRLIKMGYMKHESV